jgi:hypothetical protein
MLRTASDFNIPQQAWDEAKTQARNAILAADVAGYSRLMVLAGFDPLRIRVVPFEI